MSVREALQTNKAVGIGTAVMLLLVAAAISFYSLRSNNTRGTATGAFYSTDDGKSYFTDTIFHFPPYDQDGKTVLRAIVYSSNSGKFVGALLRFKPEAKKTLEDSYAKAESGDQPMYVFKQQLNEIMRFGVEYKLPGQDRWYSALPAVKAPDGSDCFMVPP
jgi:hypothetical protein